MLLFIAKLKRIKTENQKNKEEKNGDPGITAAMERSPVFFAVSSSVCHKELLITMKLEDVSLYWQEPYARISGVTHIWDMVVSAVYCCIVLRRRRHITGRFLLLHEIVLNVLSHSFGINYDV